MSLLAVDDLAISFGGVRAVDGVSFSVDEGQVFTIIGPNGAGKTTLFNLIFRLFAADRGHVVFAGSDISRARPDRIVRYGIARTFQNLELFEHATVLQNLLVGRHRHRGVTLAERALFLPRVRPRSARIAKRVEEVIDFLDLQPYRDSRSPACPTACARWSSWAGRSPSSQSCCCSTSRPPGSIRRRREDLAFWIDDIRDRPGHHHPDGRARHGPGERGLRPRAGAGRAAACWREGTPAEVQSNPAVVAGLSRGVRR